MKRIKSLVCAVVLLGVGGLAAAQQLPGMWRNVKFDRVGVVDHVNSEDGRIVVDDRLFPIPSNISVVLPSGSTASLSALRPGTKVGFTTTKLTPTGRPSIVKIWVLPNSYQLPVND